MLHLISMKSIDYNNAGWTNTINTHVKFCTWSQYLNVEMNRLTQKNETGSIFFPTGKSYQTFFERGDVFLSNASIIIIKKLEILHSKL